ncbi:hypothetical protein P9112_005153 [Eukaryota sp. TZLM1-RC]
MSVSPRQDTDCSQIFYIRQMQQYDRNALSIHTTSTGTEESNKEEDSGPRPPSAPPHEKDMEPGREPPPASSMSNKPDKVSGTGPSPSSPKENAGLSSDTSSALKDYKELQSVSEEMDDDEKELRQQIMKDAEAHLEPTDCCLFEQLPPLWKQISKSGRNVGFQTLGHKGDPNRVYEFP